MRIPDIEKKARALGIKNTWKYSRAKLIKTIQLKEGNFDCFGTAANYCDQTACCWREGCLKK